jgi:gamma-glutamyl hydrolase
VKFVEQSGARVIPLIYMQQTDAEIQDLMGKINGVLFPGGSGDEKYELWEEKIFKRALQMNDQGIHFPVLGICLGMQHITKYILGRSRVAPFPLTKTATSLSFTEAAAASKLFSSELNEFPLTHFSSEKGFYQQHLNGISPTQWDLQPALKEQLRILATQKDSKGFVFVDIFEGIKYPLIGLQFHPEKSTSAFSKFHPFPHSNR